LSFAEITVPSAPYKLYNSRQIRLLWDSKDRDAPAYLSRHISIEECARRSPFRRRLCRS